MEPTQTPEDELLIAEPAETELLSTERKRWPFRLVAALLAAAMLVLAFGGILRLLRLPPMGMLVASAQLSRSADVQNYMASIAAVSTGNRHGTGFVLASDGRIISNAHIIEDAETVMVRLPGQQEQFATEWHANPLSDLAVLSVPTSSDGLSLELEIVPEPGDKLILIGNPYGFFRIVTEVRFAGFYEIGQDRPPLYAVSGSIYQGHSGSPLINQEGKVVGILFATAGQSSDPATGLVIPAQTIQRFLDEEGNK